METGIIKHAEILIYRKKYGLKEPLEQFLEEKNTDFHDQCLILFLVGEYTRISGDHFFYNGKEAEDRRTSGSHRRSRHISPVDGFQEKETAFLQKISEWF